MIKPRLNGIQESNDGFASAFQRSKFNSIRDVFGETEHKSRSSEPSVRFGSGWRLLGLFVGCTR